MEIFLHTLVTLCVLVWVVTWWLLAFHAIDYQHSNRRRLFLGMLAVLVFAIGVGVLTSL